MLPAAVQGFRQGGTTGFECGMTIDKFNDIKEGDVFECFVMEQIKD